MIRKSKITLLIAMLLLCLAAEMPVKAAERFRDVESGSYYYHAVQWAVQGGITSGTNSGIFSPKANCTRGQIVTFLYKANAGEKVSSDTSFQDVEAGSYYYDAVNWAVSKHITSGTSKNTFSPGKICTRAEAVTFLWKAAGSPKARTANAFQDVKAEKYYYDAVNWAVDEKIISGTGDGKFSPNKICTRAEIVTFLYKLYGNESSDSDENYFSLYADYVRSLEKIYGKGDVEIEEEAEGKGYDYATLRNVGIVRLLDMNNDGIDEMVVGYEDRSAIPYSRYVSLCTYDGKKMIVYREETGYPTEYGYQYKFYRTSEQGIVWQNSWDVRNTKPTTGSEYVYLNGNQFVRADWKTEYYSKYELYAAYPWCGLSSPFNGYDAVSDVRQSLNETKSVRKTLGIMD